jgi:chromosome segregation ATPase
MLSINANPKPFHNHPTPKAVSMKNPVLAGLLIATLIVATPAGAEIYKYVDENGQKRWTDDLSQVPKEQRPTVERFEGVTDTPATTITEGLPAEAQETEPDGDASDEPSPPDRAALEQEKADLDTQFQQLMKERTEIEASKTQTLSSQDREALNNRIAAYNKKTEQYEAKLDRFNREVERYNQQINAAKQKAAE